MIFPFYHLEFKSNFDMVHIIIPPILYSLYNWNKNVLYHRLCVKDYGIKVSFEIMSLNVMLLYLINYMLDEKFFWMSPCIKRFHWVFVILLWPSHTQSLVSLRSLLWYMPQMQKKQKKKTLHLRFYSAELPLYRHQ